MSQPEPVYGHELPRLLQAVADLADTGHRRLVAIAGMPASGKSTLADELVAALVADGVSAANVPMDGFHLDNRILEARGLRARKGAPETFDAAGFVALMQRMRTEDEVFYPIFDRAQDQSIAGAGCVTSDCDLIVVEGNYLLFREPPWNQLVDIWDLSIWIDTPEQVVLERCTQRWLDHGHSPEAAHARASSNDLPNAQRIGKMRLTADIQIGDPVGASRHPVDTASFAT